MFSIECAFLVFDCGMSVIKFCVSGISCTPSTFGASGTVAGLTARSVSECMPKRYAMLLAAKNSVGRFS